MKTKKRSRVLAVTVAVRGMSATRATSPKKLAASERGQLLAAARDVDFSLHDHEELLTSLALLAEDLARAAVDILGHLRQLGELLAGQAGEQCHILERLNLRVPGEERHMRELSPAGHWAVRRHSAVPVPRHWRTRADRRPPRGLNPTSAAAHLLSTRVRSLAPRLV